MVTTIESCELLLLSARYRPEEVWGWPGGVYRGWTSAFVRLTGADGTIGHGEIGDGLNTPDLVPPLLHRAAQMVVGLPAEPRAVLQALTRGAPGWGHGGLFSSVVAGIEMATFDLLGRSLGTPASVLLGGPVRTELPVYASGGLDPCPDAVRAEVRRHVSDGFRAVKIRIGYGTQTDVRRVAAAREELGPDADLMLDLGASYLPEPPDLRTVVTLARALEPYSPYWLEDPLPRTDVTGHARLRGDIDMRVATGENERTPDHVQRLLDAEAVDVIQTDAVYVGGILRQMELAALVESAGARLAPHTWCSGPGVMANATVVACAPAGLYVELPRVPNALRERTLAQALRLTDGRMQLPDLPGLGIQLDDELATWAFDPDAGPRLHNARDASSASLGPEAAR
ncbi:mandelate racemase/muconate lactonizing enzyme family protein [Georgenia sp. TF02-10]|uniref:mandelate racemase/muconate lactonizing enzyme family protein n=1 Tax=Georgenia sp. TF02-10 TaxID=2917725 RepID=UPI001FA81389|nr:mandelate racemase/muconate lactonizing enzyme family protein [Georgenia sp. TF02-10]UNX54295.1 mandelate racemase/muconate lactonizing enzyme family protein [Georgenia sp. TF02-10]